MKSVITSTRLFAFTLQFCGSLTRKRRTACFPLLARQVSAKDHSKRISPRSPFGAGSSMLGLLVAIVWSTLLMAQTVAPPEISYIFPPGGRAGETVDVVLGTYDVTPDAQFFLLGDDGAKLEVTGTAGPLLLHGTPYFSGPKGYYPRPLPREIPATLYLPADLPEGRIYWQIANANGSSNVGTFVVSCVRVCPCFVRVLSDLGRS